MRCMVVALMVVSACAADPGPVTDDTLAGPGADDDELVVTTASCSSVWQCDQVCGIWIHGTLVFYGTNVLHRYCDDGSDTVVVTHACDEECY